ncbi:MAG TPA: beta-N-acetylglucosaminidase domain-containing protein [Terriglobia bacterium]|nr:beta-N-acetylglucosaminidase domain-containing protein [Terriglobia bacterium]
MRTLQLKIAFLFILTTLGATNIFARGVWSVISTRRLDPRLLLQLDALARQNRTTVRFSTAGPTPSRSLRGHFTIELREAESREQFLATLKKAAGDVAKDLTRELANEGYTLDANYEGSSTPQAMRITAVSAQGFHNALLRIPQLLHAPATKASPNLAPPAQFVALTRSGRNALLSITDFPSFPERGIVEGFYGKPWSHQDRVAMLRFEGQHAMNVYYYAPKDDPYHRLLWRKPYPPAQMKQLGDLVNTARANFVDFCFAISPGLSMTYSDDQDFADLTSKLDGVGKLGVSCFALFLDDVPQELQNPQDKARFKTLAGAHTYVINKLYHYLKSRSAENRLVVTPTTYTNDWGSRDYIKELGAGVDPDVPIVWTGTKVVSPTITVAQATEWGALLHRKPLVWDNFPVNDGISWRVNLGPMRGRDPNLATAVSGLFSNPMVEPRASMIPLQTIAEYLWNSQAYNPEAAQRRAITQQYGSDAMKKLAPFLTTYSDYWWDDNIFKPLFVEERKTIDVPEIRRRIALLEANARALRNKPRFQSLMKEISPLPGKTTERLTEVLTDPAYRRLPDQRLAWRDDYGVLYAPRVSDPPVLDGDFAKWQGGPLYVLDQTEQIAAGGKLWRGAGQFSARFALGWDGNYLYVGADVTDPNLYQPFTGRDIAKGDVVSLILETAFRENYSNISTNGDEYQLLLSPGDFASVKPYVYSEEDYLPLRPVQHDYNQEIKTAWKKTASGFSGDIAIPVAWFDGGKFQAGYEIGLTLGAQKALPQNSGAASEGENIPHIILRSKADRVFPARIGNPSTYQRLVLIDSKRQ